MWKHGTDPKWRPDPSYLSRSEYLSVGKLWMKPKPKKQKYPRKGRGPDFGRGLNKIILDVLADGETHKAVECQAAILKMEAIHLILSGSNGSIAEFWRCKTYASQLMEVS